MAGRFAGDHPAGGRRHRGLRRHLRVHEDVRATRPQGQGGRRGGLGGAGRRLRQDAGGRLRERRRPHQVRRRRAAAAVHGGGPPGEGRAGGGGHARTLREIGAIESSAGKITLRMSVGVHSGTFLFFLVGSSHRELVVTGPAASETVPMEGHGRGGRDPGEPGHRRPCSRRRCWVIPRETGCCCGASRRGWSSTPSTSVIPVTRRRSRLRASRSRSANTCWPARRSPSTGRSRWRSSTSTASTPSSRRRGRMRWRSGSISWCRTVQEAADEHGVTFLGTDIDHDGGKIILMAGAPSALGDDEERMLLALRRVMDASLSIPIRIGVNSGPVFAGDIGPRLPAHLHGDGRRGEPRGPGHGEGRARSAPGDGDRSWRPPS